jgi:transposase
VDEAGFYLLVKLGHTWAKKGQSPVFQQGCRYQHLSVISAISAEGDLHYQLQEGNFTGETVVAFLKDLLRFFRQDLLIIWDGASIHRDEVVKQFLAQENQERIYLAKIPPYSPELNPDEQVWQTLKDDMLKNVICKNLSQLKEKLASALTILKTQSQKIINFFKHPEVQFYKS